MIVKISKSNQNEIDLRLINVDNDPIFKLEKLMLLFLLLLLSLLMRSPKMTDGVPKEVQSLAIGPFKQVLQNKFFYSLIPCTGQQVTPKWPMKCGKGFTPRFMGDPENFC